MDSARKPRFGQHPYLTEQPLSSSHSGTVLDIESSGDHQSSGFTRPFFKHGGWKLFLVLVLALGLTVSAISSWAWYAYVSSQRHQAVTSSLGSLRSIVGTSLERDNDLVATVNALVASHPQLTNGSLAVVLSRLNPSLHYPGSIAFTYVENVSRAGLAGFEKVTERDPPLGVATAPSVPVRASLNGRPGYCLTRLAFVDLLPSQAILKDMLLSWVGPYLSAQFNFCDSSFANLLDTSARTGRSSVASVVSLLNPPPGMPAVPSVLRAALAQFPVFIEVSPVYTGTDFATSQAARSRELAGWTMGVFDAGKILSPALTNVPGVFLSLDYASPGSRPTEMAHGGQPQPGVAIGRLTFPADPGWVIDAAVNPRGSGPPPLIQGFAVFFASLALTLLLAILLGLLIRSRRSALVLVEKRTSELRHQALYDSLTGLPNRLHVNQKARELLGRAHGEGVRIAVFFIDLDDFKKVNDTLGHSAGDDLLRAVAARLSASVRDSDTVGRLGGDEFVVLSEVCDEGVNVVAARLLAALREPFRLTDATILSTSASIGIATGLYDSPDELLRDADTAMYGAKSMGKNCHVVFRQEMHEALKNQLAMETDLADALANKEFFLVYQPIVDLETGAPRDVEALLRWRHPERGVLGPLDFIAVLESSDLIIDVGRFVLMEACRQVRTWHNLGRPVGISVNVGARQLRYDVLIEHVREALQSTGLDPRYLTLEVTESTLMVDPKTTAQRLSALSDLGVRIAIDDFGTGYASLSYLQEFPVDTVKIDRSFVAQLDTSTGSDFLDALIHLGKSLHLVTIAEGIEEISQLNHVKLQGCHLGQGFLFSKPVPAAEIERIITTARYLVGDPLPSVKAIS